MPVVFEVAIRPTPLHRPGAGHSGPVHRRDAKLVIEGRHDPCIVHRAVPVIEAAAALAACELLGI